MKWNYEWVDLQTIDQMISDCWRMNSQQLKEFQQQLWQQQDLIFAGDMGTAFIELAGKAADGKVKADWSGMQKDIHTIQKLIQRGMNWNQISWENQYEELTERPKAFFRTGLGEAFIRILGERLEIGLTEEQKRMRSDIRQIKMLCDAYDFQKEEDIRRVGRMLEADRSKMFSSWLGEGFADQFQERFAKKEEPLPELSPKEVRRQLKQEKKQQKIRQKQEAKAQAGSGKDAGQEKAGRKAAGRRIILSLFLLAAIASLCILFFIKTEQGQSWRQWLEENVISLLDQKQAAYEAGEQSQLEDQEQAAYEAGEQSQSEDQEQAALASAREQSGQKEETAGEESHLEVILKRRIDDAKDEKQEKELDKTAQTGEGEPVVLPELLSEYKELHKKYPDLFGWLKIPDTGIDFPVMQCLTDAEDYYYLSHDYTGQPDPEGAVFADKTSSIYPLDNNLVLYGHHMSNGHVFGELVRYENEAFYQTHQEIQFDTIYEEGSYEVVAVLLTRVLYQDEVGFRYYRLFNYETEAQFEECLNFIEENQLFDTGKELEYGDQTLMLSTCEPPQSNGRLVVVAKKI